MAHSYDCVVINLVSLLFSPFPSNYPIFFAGFHHQRLSLVVRRPRPSGLGIIRNVRLTGREWDLRLIRVTAGPGLFVVARGSVIALMRT